VGLLTFDDSSGTRWRVWQVETPAARAHLMDASFRNGWLVFEKEDGSERRRLAQVPEDWSALAPDHLARPVSSVTTMKMKITPRPADFRHER
jgi:hypothetical protein